MVEHAQLLVASLTPTSACSDLRALSERLPAVGTPDARRRIDELRSELANTRAMVAAGRTQAAAQALPPLRAAIEATNYRPLQASAALTAALIARDLGQAKPAADLFREAVLAAEAGRDDRTAARAWIELVNLRAKVFGDAARAAESLQHAEAAVERIGPDLDLRADLAAARGVALRVAGKGPLARAAFADAEALLARSKFDRSADRARVVLNLSGLLGESGEYPLAIKRVKEAIAQLRASLGEHHPEVAFALVLASASLLAIADQETADRYLAEAEPLLLASVGADHPHMGHWHMQRGLLAARRGDVTGALAHYARAIEIFNATSGGDTAEIAEIELYRAYGLMSLGQRGAANQALARAANIFTDLAGPAAPGLSRVHLAAAWVAYHFDDYARALTLGEATLDELVAAYGPNNTFLRDAHDVVAQIHLQLGDLKKAERSMRLALDTFTNTGELDLPISAPYAASLAELLVDGKRFAEVVALLAPLSAAYERSPYAVNESVLACKLALAEAQHALGHDPLAIEALESVLGNPAAAALSHRYALVQFRLATLLPDRGAERRRSIELATAALPALLAYDPKEAARARTWLGSHR
ncbi:MAG: tetratricopeptide repeat protein [Proteobacteria bacterium]|nr:tetratricopeptide repeat protein [Pseudomonadota bacterium]